MTLTHAQHARLDRLADKEPNARIVGWHHLGPVVQRPIGRSWVDPNGRLRALPKKARWSWT